MRSIPTLIAFGALLVVACLFISCDPEEKKILATEDIGFEVEDLVGVQDMPLENLSVVQNPSNTLSFFVEWGTAQPATSELTLLCGTEINARYDDQSLRTEHSILVMGLMDGLDCNLRVDSWTENKGALGRQDETLSPGPLMGSLPTLDAKVHLEDSMEPGWTLLNLTNGFDGVPLTVAIVDPQGRYRWYHQLSVPNSGADTEIFMMDSGVFVCGTRVSIPFTEIAWSGEVVWENSQDAHHDCRFPGADTERLRYLVDVPAAQCSGGFGGGHMVEMNRTTGEELYRFPFCKLWTPPVYESDWSHLNAIEPFPNEDAVLLSSRSQHSLFKANLDTNEVVWALGLNGEFAMDTSAYFYRQHAPEIQSNGNILLFDNGDDEHRPSSRLLELSYDETAKTAQVVWEWAPTPALYNPIWGDADRLANGNTLGTFGQRSTSISTELFEVTKAKDVVWQLELPPGWGTYRADRVQPPYFVDLTAP
ncbi:MAG: hypothetical protein AUK47_13230 [Deltaproteobacteria bacterium CG2_30_63_29]|nr:MAG: hypothetical protein AUK47_13230 [Deltaproteobacteria bacterium CG2_30_63_29]PJB37803.1 MAG: hypothetical protein CO108_20350 [Deltaproteobacteria bacterium CG_4_9_14_3_um_filter_63_12]